ncbi:uncharacterized protein LOC116924198 isoform X1 [Daphnia magna]|uniref:uncharacterized protein LOC116924198 isoform X1 n=1 Tax=Daphnia magna TaxID=35525 RepID=UPI001E1BA537|nr:uncharacterized protein LOC116924198 isoform X1 [Daphnia magna]
MENQAEVVETLVDPDDEENIANSSYRIDEASETNTDVPRTVPGINLDDMSLDSSTHDLSYNAEAVPEVCESQLMYNAANDDGKANTGGSEDAEKNDPDNMPAILLTAMRNQLSSIHMVQDNVHEKVNPVLETSSREDTVILEETSDCKRSCSVNLMCEGLTSNAESSLGIETEEFSGKNVAKASEVLHTSISKMSVMQAPSEICDAIGGQKGKCLEGMKSLPFSEKIYGSIDEKQIAIESQQIKECESTIFTILKKPDGSLSDSSTGLCEGTTCNTPNVIPCMVQEDQVLRRIRLLQKQVEHTHDLYSRKLSEDFLSVKKFFEDLNQQDTLFQEMSSQADLLKETLDSVLQLPESSKSDVLDRLEACFNSGHWLEKSVKTKELASCKQLMSKGYVSLKYGGVSKVKAIINQHCRPQLSTEDAPQSNVEDILCDPYLVTVTSIIDPGEFYVVRLCDSGKLDTILTTLKENADFYPIPLETSPGQMYAVRNSALNWFRGVCGKECGRHQVGDQPSEILYEFFMIDQGHHERIPASSIRLLPMEILNIPPIARECTLNQNFQGTTWSLQTISLFKQMTRQSPMNMKVFKQHGGVLEVDLGQLISFGEAANIVSVRDALFFSHRPTSTKPSLRKFKPKFLIPNVDLRKEFSVNVSSAETPNNFYVQILDEELRSYRLMQDELQTEMANVTLNSSSNFNYIEKGFICAVKYLGDWYRCLVEEIYQQNRVLVFYVDTGHRQTVHGSECLNLLETFLDLPCQALRCVLDGINPLKPRATKMNSYRRRQTSWNLWSREVIESIRGYRNKQGVIIVENWKVGDVGRLDQELTAFVVLYRDGEQFCLNQMLARAGVVNSTKGHKYLERSIITSDSAMQCGISQPMLTDSVESGMYAPSTEADFTSLIPGIPITEELITQAPSVANGRDSDQKNFEKLVGDGDSNYSDCLPVSVFPMSSYNPSPILEVSDAGNTSPQALDLHRNELCSGLAGSTSSINKNPDNEMESSIEPLKFALEYLPASKFNDCLPNPPVRKHASEDVSAGYGKDLSLKTVLTNFTSCGTSNSSGIEVLAPALDQQKEQKTINLTNEKSDGTCSINNCQTDLVGTLGTQPESETSVTVSYVWMDSPDAMYFRTADMQAQYEELRYKMKQHYGNIGLREKTKFEVGFRCAIHEHHSWWRAEVVCMDDYPKCEVLFVDTGYHRTVRAKHIYELELGFDEIKRLVLKCSLYGVFSGTENGTWKENCIKYIHDRLLGSESISIFRRQQRESKYAALPVMCLYVYNVEGGPLQIPGKTQINLNDELVSLGLAQNYPGPLPSSNVIPVLRAWRLSEPPKVGSVFWAIVTWVNLTGEIYLHDIKSVPAMNEITKWLNEAYSGTEPTDADLRCRPGDLCIAKYKIDNKWYRAIVKKTEVELEKVTVFFVDYGTLDSVDCRDIRLNIMLEELPTQTVCCKLFNIRPPVEDLTDRKWDWPVKTLDHLHELIVDKEFRVIVKGKGPPLPVALITRKQSSIASYLVENKMAELTDPNLWKKKSKKKKCEKK